MQGYRRIFACMMVIMVAFLIYSTIAQSPVTTSVREPTGIPSQIAALQAQIATLQTTVSGIQTQVATLQTTIAGVQQFCSNLNSYCLDDAYQRKTKYTDLIAHYSNVTYTHINLADGEVPITDWLPTVQAKLNEINAYIATLESHN